MYFVYYSVKYNNLKIAKYFHYLLNNTLIILKKKDNNCGGSMFFVTSLLGQINGDECIALWTGSQISRYTLYIRYILGIYIIF